MIITYLTIITNKVLGAGCAVVGGAVAGTTQAAGGFTRGTVVVLCIINLTNMCYIDMIFIMSDDQIRREIRMPGKAADWPPVRPRMLAAGLRCLKLQIAVAFI